MKQIKRLFEIDPWKIRTTKMRTDVTKRVGLSGSFLLRVRSCRMTQPKRNTAYYISGETHRLR